MPTSKKRVMIIPNEVSLAVVGRLFRETGYSYTDAINHALKEYETVVAHASVDLVAILKPDEWNAIAALITSESIFGGFEDPTSHPIHEIIQNLRASPGHCAKWKVDMADLCRRLQPLTAAHGFAILAAVRHLSVLTATAGTIPTNWWELRYRFMAGHGVHPSETEQVDETPPAARKRGGKKG